MAKSSFIAWGTDERTIAFGIYARQVRSLPGDKALPFLSGVEVVKGLLARLTSGCFRQI